MYCFATQEEIPRERDRFLAAKFEEVISALLQDNQERGSLKMLNSAIGVRWVPPSEGWVALNTDGAARGNPGPAGAGGVIRGERGEWIAGFSEHLGRCSSLKAELRAVLRGLRLAHICIYSSDPL
uniref:RNase H type-1 domain-containing protein n=1 Tax=Opuntia streptacantha TaxID=393608 RepID=A0A7C8ZGN9_OPUST